MLIYTNNLISLFMSLLRKPTDMPNSSLIFVTIKRNKFFRRWSDTVSRAPATAFSQPRNRVGKEKKKKRKKKKKYSAEKNEDPNCLETYGTRDINYTIAIEYL